jgi:hypothetical protein
MHCCCTYTVPVGDPERDPEEDDLLAVAAGGASKKKLFNVNRYNFVLNTHFASFFQL